MNRRRCSCRHCATPTEQAPVVEQHEPVQLPTVPRSFRVHHDGRTQDCVLHPDGRMTMQIGSEVLESALSFDEMRERNWATALIEWDPPMQAAEPEIEAAELLQAPLDGIAA